MKRGPIGETVIIEEGHKLGNVFPIKNIFLCNCFYLTADFSEFFSKMWLSSLMARKLLEHQELFQARINSELYNIYYKNYIII